MVQLQMAAPCWIRLELLLVPVGLWMAREKNGNENINTFKWANYGATDGRYEILQHSFVYN